MTGLALLFAILVTVEDSGTLVCRPALPIEAAGLGHAADESLHVLTPDRAGVRQQAAGGFTIVLRGTEQLESRPDAKAAFLRAAAKWTSRLSSPITIVIDVDFGPTMFGTPFPAGVLGSTAPQALFAFNSYETVRVALAGRATLGAALPMGALPTDLGAVRAVEMPSAEWRALGLIAAVADPAAEEARYGSPPSIGFNSARAWDFDSSDGIDFQTYDFEAAATHEIGHVLGFESAVGAVELFGGLPYATGWDFFRFRPGVNSSSFGGALRVLSSGDPQVFFDGGQQLAVSTGRPDGNGGDGRQASHWKDDAFAGGLPIGIMDPSLPAGFHEDVTANDLAALHAMGHTLAPASGTACTVDSTTLCLYNGRFKVQASYRDYSNNGGSGRAVALTSDTGYFWFFSASNVEAVVKIVSFCGGGSESYAVYAGGLTDLEVTLTVTDTRNGTARTYLSPLGAPFTLIRDGPFSCP